MCILPRYECDGEMVESRCVALVPWTNAHVANPGIAEDKKRCSSIPSNDLEWVRP